MANLGRLWAGKLFGTNTGNLSAEFDTDGGEVTGTIRLMDERFGPVVYKVQGSFDGAEVVVTGDASQAQEGILTGTVTARAALTAEGQLRGTWSSTIGTGGTFHLFPHDPPVSPTTPLPGAPPEQLHSATRVLGALRLYGDDVRELVQFVRRDFNQGRVIVTYSDHGTEVSKFAEDFLAEFDRVGELRQLKLNIQEPEAYGLNRVVVVDLDPEDKNEVHVQGVQESWVVGKAEAVAAHLRRKQKALASNVQRLGLNVNAVIFIAMLALLPELTLERRFIFILLVFALLWLLINLHKKFIPNLIVRPTVPPPGILGQIGPQTVSWLLAVAAGLASAIAYGVLSGDLPGFRQWLSTLLS